MNENGWHPCLKQLTRCLIRLPDGRTFEATNSCNVGDSEVCPRVVAGSRSGEGYELCGPPKHAEQEAAKLVAREANPANPRPGTGGTAYLYGHDWMCMDCQHALTAVGVRTHVITGASA